MAGLLERQLLQSYVINQYNQSMTTINHIAASYLHIVTKIMIRGTAIVSRMGP